MQGMAFVPLVAEDKAQVLSKPEKAFCEPCEGGNCDECLYHPVNMAKLQEDLRQAGEL